jgi:hypothetical protein
MDEFIVLLVIAVVIIGAFMVIGTPLANWTTGNWTTSGGAYREIASFELGKVGLSESEVSRTAKFGSFTLGQTQSDTLKEMASVGVTQGYFGSDPKKFDISVDQNVLNNIKDVKISFSIGETNLYGNLIIKWNDKIVFDKLANLNRYDVVIEPGDVRESNTLEIAAANPGLYFWAATLYDLENFKVAAEYGPEKFVSFKVYPNEIEAWNKGILRFYTTSGQAGEIRVKLNGMEIYVSSNPEHLVEEEYDYSDIGNAIKIGDNILAFKATNVYELDDVEFEIRLSSGAAVKERDFNVTSADLSALSGNDKGRIEFEVDSVYRQGVLNIKLNDNQLSVQTVREGKNTINFDDSDVLQGANTISFSGTGSWDISNVKVGIA